MHVILPEGVDDPRHPSGGNAYDRRVCDELTGSGWTLREHGVPGRWPRPTPGDHAALARVLAGIPDHATVLVDGLVASAAEGLVAEARRLRTVVLLHMPLAEVVRDPRMAAIERDVLGAVAAVVTPSRWARQWVLDHHGIPVGHVHVAQPGTDLGPPAAGSATGGALLYAAAVTPAKGHDTLLEALREVRDLDWYCTCAGALDLDPAHADRLAEAARRTGIAERVSFPGPLDRSRLDAIRSGTDLVVSPSHRESFGMAVTEGLARAIPVIATSVGGHPEALGRADDGSRPGLLVPAGDAGRLAAALRRWLTDAELREQLRRAAGRRRAGLTTWTETARRVGEVLSAGGRMNPAGPSAVFADDTAATEG